jgi:hypothetical protein
MLVTVAPARDIAFVPMSAGGRERVRLVTLNMPSAAIALWISTVDVGRKSVPLTALEDTPERVDDRSIERAHGPDFFWRLLGHDQPHASFGLGQRCRELDDAPDRIHRRDGQIETVLRRRISPRRPDREVDLLLAPEVIVDEHGSYGSAPRRVHARPLEPARGELFDGGLEDARPVRFGRLRLAWLGSRSGYPVGAGLERIDELLNWLHALRLIGAGIQRSLSPALQQDEARHRHSPALPAHRPRRVQPRAEALPTPIEAARSCASPG